MLKKHRITIRLYWASLEKDVQDKAYRMARLAKLSVEDEDAADKLESELTLTAEDMAILKRAMAEGLAEVVTMCREYVWSKSHFSDDLTLGEDDVIIRLMMPVNFNLAGCLSIGHAIHAYIVAKAMFEWFRYTVPSRADEQAALCTAARKEIRTIINARVRAARKAQSLTVIVGDDNDSKGDDDNKGDDNNKGDDDNKGDGGDDTDTTDGAYYDNGGTLEAVYYDDNGTLKQAAYA